VEGAEAALAHVKEEAAHKQSHALSLERALEQVMCAHLLLCCVLCIHGRCQRARVHIICMYASCMCALHVCIIYVCTGIQVIYAYMYTLPAY